MSCSAVGHHFVLAAAFVAQARASAGKDLHTHRSYHVEYAKGVQSETTVDTWIDHLVDRAQWDPLLQKGDFDSAALSKASAAPSRVMAVSDVSNPKGAASSTVSVSGQTIAKGKYLLCQNPLRSTSGKSRIYRGYRSDGDGRPTGSELVIKVSSDVDSLSREAHNYDRVTSGFNAGRFRGRFANRLEFLPELDAEPFSPALDQGCALVMEAGQADLRDVLDERGGEGLEGKPLRDAAVKAAQCIEALHASRIAWTDVKSENFIIVGHEGHDSGGDGALPEVRGIDVESAVPFKANPISFSPDTCPPELARIAASGSKADLARFSLDYSFDIWSYGMLLYELAMGRRYFAGKAPGQITSSLASKDFQVDVSDVTDDRLRDLIEQCLSLESTKRPNIGQVMRHPYFWSSGPLALKLPSLGFPGGSGKAPVHTEQLLPMTKARLNELKREFGITGQTVANGKYLLCEKPLRTRTLEVYNAYLSGPEWAPTGAELAIKISSDCEAISREAANYDRISSRRFHGRFVDKIEYLPEIDAESALTGAQTRSYDNKCAVVLEAGEATLKAMLASRGRRRGLQGQALRDAAVAAAQCVEAMHSSGIVWADLSAESFVVMDAAPKEDDHVIKGTSIGNAVPRGSSPVGYNAESCPPEFARASIVRASAALPLDYSFDIWSYGMLLYELAMGQGYFAGKNPSILMRTLAYDDFVADVSGVDDDTLRDLIEQCLKVDPKDRPKISQILRHPFLAASRRPFFGMLR